MQTRRPFTLIELVICIAILAMVGSLFAFRGKDLMRHYGFSASVSKVASKVRLARVLASNYRADVRCHVASENQKFFLILESDEPQLKKLPQLRGKCALSEIDGLEVDGKAASEVEILFSGSGGVFPECQLRLKCGKKQKDLSIELSPIG